MSQIASLDHQVRMGIGTILRDAKANKLVRILPVGINFRQKAFGSVQLLQTTGRRREPNLLVRQFFDCLGFVPIHDGRSFVSQVYPYRAPANSPLHPRQPSELLEFKFRLFSGVWRGPSLFPSVPTLALYLLRSRARIVTKIGGTLGRFAYRRSISIDAPVGPGFGPGKLNECHLRNPQ